MNESAPIVEAQRVSRTFDNGRISAVVGASLRVEAGERIAIVGASGSGKSTLLNLLCGLDQPTSGVVRVDGQVPPTARAWAAVRAIRIGMVFQAFHLLPTLSARENVEVPMFGVEPSARRRRERATALLEDVGLSARLDQRPFDLSGGERQRVAIARSLANDPALLLADEPTGNLDTRTSAAILDTIFALCETRRMAVVIVTHDEHVASRAQRRLTMADGMFAGDGDGV